MIYKMFKRVPRIFLERLKGEEYEAALDFEKKRFKREFIHDLAEKVDLQIKVERCRNLSDSIELSTSYDEDKSAIRVLYNLRKLAREEEGKKVVNQLLNLRSNTLFRLYVDELNRLWPEIKQNDPEAPE